MMDLPLAMMSPNAAPSGGPTTGGHAQDPDGFAATLTSMLGEAGREVVEMVEALQTLAGLESADRDQLATVGWPLPAFLALSEAAAGELAADGSGDEVPADVGALLGQLAEIAAGSPDGAADSELASEIADLVAAEPPEGSDGSPAGEVPVGGTPVEEVPIEDQALAAAAARAGSPADGQRPDHVGPDRVGRAAGNVEVAAEDAEAARNRGQVSAEAARARGDERAAHRAADGAAPDRPRGPGAVPATVTSDAAGAEASGEHGVTLTGAELSRRAAEQRPVGLPSAIQRIIDAVERLEHMPPPRQLTLELGDVRLRVSMEDGQVRLTLLDTEGEAGDELLRDAREELANRGFDLGDGDQAGSERDGGRDQATSFGRRVAASGPTPTPVRTEPAGALRL